MTEYIDKKTWRSQRTRLTRAINSGDPIRVLRVVRDVRREWEGYVWPDDWARFQRASDDALYRLEQERW